MIWWRGIMWFDWAWKLISSSHFHLNRFSCRRILRERVLRLRSSCHVREGHFLPRFRIQDEEHLSKLFYGFYLAALHIFYFFFQLKKARWFCRIARKLIAWLGHLESMRVIPLRVICRLLHLPSQRESFLWDNLQSSSAHPVSQKKCSHGEGFLLYWSSTSCWCISSAGCQPSSSRKRWGFFWKFLSRRGDGSNKQRRRKLLIRNHIYDYFCYLTYSKVC